MSNRMSNRQRGLYAFTIMEVLVVIGIIGVLAGILFPIFARAKESGYKAAAILQAKQLGMGIKLYADDHDGKYLPSTNYGLPTSSKNRIWTAALKAIVKDEKIFIAPGSDGQYTESWDKRGWLSIGYSSATALDPANGCTDEMPDTSGCVAFKSAVSFDQSDNPSQVGMFAITPAGEVANRYLGYEFSPYNGTPVSGLDQAHQPPLVADYDLVKEALPNFTADMLKPIFARYGSNSEGQGVTPVIFADSHAKAVSAKQIATGAENIIWRFR